MDEMNAKKDSSIVRWMREHDGDAGFGEALKTLVSYACAEWFLRSRSVVVTPADALSRFVLAGISEYPVGKWLESPERYCAEIADFCEKVKTGFPLEGLSSEVPDELDLRGVECPGNAVRSRLVMSGYPRDRVLKIALDEGSPIENVPGALVADGCNIVSREKKEGFWVISVVHPADKKVN